MSPGQGTQGARPEHEAFTESQQFALVCHDTAAQQALIAAALQESGLKVQIAADAPDAIERMRKTTYRVIVLDEEFQGSPAVGNPVLQAIHTMAISVRRHIFVVLLGKPFKTLDNTQAFAKSVNIVVGANDLPQIKGILRQGIAENDEFYKVFRDVLHAAGRR